MYTIVVADNGIGLPQNLDYRKSRSLGLRLVNELAVSQLCGSLNVISVKGTELRIQFTDKNRPMRTNQEWQRQQ